MTKRLKITGSAAAVLAAGTLGLGLMWPQSSSSQSQLYAQQTLASQTAQEDLLLGADRLSDAFRSASQVLRPSVVTVTSLVERSPRVRMNGRGFGMRDITCAPKQKSEREHCEHRQNVLRQVLYHECPLRIACCTTNRFFLFGEHFAPPCSRKKAAVS